MPITIAWMLLAIGYWLGESNTKAAAERPFPISQNERTTHQ